MQTHALMVLVQVVDSDEEKELYGWSPEIRLADYKKEVKRQEKQEEERKRIERDRDPLKAAEEEARANRQLFKAGVFFCFLYG
jgi:hypothetical protein